MFEIDFEIYLLMKSESNSIYGYLWRKFIMTFVHFLNNGAAHTKCNCNCITKTTTFDSMIIFAILRICWSLSIKKRCHASTIVFGSSREHLIFKPGVMVPSAWFYKSLDLFTWIDLAEKVWCIGGHQTWAFSKWNLISQAICSTLRPTNIWFAIFHLNHLDHDLEASWWEWCSWKILNVNGIPLMKIFLSKMTEMPWNMIRFYFSIIFTLYNETIWISRARYDKN